MSTDARCDESSSSSQFTGFSMLMSPTRASNRAPMSRAASRDASASFSWAWYEAGGSYPGARNRRGSKLSGRSSKLIVKVRPSSVGSAFQIGDLQCGEVARHHPARPLRPLDVATPEVVVGLLFSV